MCGLPAGSMRLLALADSSPDQVQRVVGELSLDRGFHGLGLWTLRPGVGVVPRRQDLWWPRRRAGLLESRWVPEGPEGLHRGQPWRPE